jgi:hypothetical protein
MEWEIGVQSSSDTRSMASRLANVHTTGCSQFFAGMKGVRSQPARLGMHYATYVPPLWAVWKARAMEIVTRRKNQRTFEIMYRAAQRSLFSKHIIDGIIHILHLTTVRQEVAESMRNAYPRDILSWYVLAWRASPRDHLRCSALSSFRVRREGYQNPKFIVSDLQETM